MEWVKRWGAEISEKPVKPGIYRLRAGGFLVRVSWTDKRGKQHRMQRSLPTATLAEAQLESARLRVEGSEKTKLSPLFAEYAASLLQRRVDLRRIKSAASIAQWATTLQNSLIPAFGTIRVSELSREDVLEWFSDLGRKVNSGEMSPRTANGYMRVMRTICSEIAEEFDTKLATRRIDLLSEAEHPAYSKEDPNSLTADQLHTFLFAIKIVYPQHLAFATLGFVTGLRPSHIRPIRRRGLNADIDFTTGILQIRRSHTLGQVVMNTTKTEELQTIALPRDVVDLLRWHSGQLDEPTKRFNHRGHPPDWWTPAMRESELLFPGRAGGFLSNNHLARPFADVSQRLGLPFTVTPRGMRRTFVNLARTGGMRPAVESSISAHRTTSTRLKYSFVPEDEQREALEGLVSRVKAG